MPYGQKNIMKKYYRVAVAIIVTQNKLKLFAVGD